MNTNKFVTKKNVTINDFQRVCRTCLTTVDLQSISELFNSGFFPDEIVLNKYTQVLVCYY